MPAATLANTLASLSWCGISISTTDCFGSQAHDRSFGKIVMHMLLRQDAPLLRSLARTSACSSESSGTGCGLRCLPRSLAAALSAAAAPPPSSAVWDAFQVEWRPPLLTAPEFLPTQTSRRRVPPSQAATMLLISGCCVQSPSLPGRSGLHSISPRNRSSNIHVLTVASVILHLFLSCTYPEICAKPTPGASYENNNRSKVMIPNLAF